MSSGIRTNGFGIIDNGSSISIGTSSNNTVIDHDGTLKFNGNATTFDDIPCPLLVRTVGVGRPSEAAFNSSATFKHYQFAVGDYVNVDAVKLLRGWKEGSPIEVHLHWATGALNATTVKGVQWELMYSIANPQVDGGTVVFPVETAVSVESPIVIGEAAFTHKTTSFGFISPAAGIKIGALVLLSIRRIASVTNATPATAPFGMSVGIRYEKDTLGSRTTRSK